MTPVVESSSLRFEEDVPLAPFTTLGSGGRSRYLCRVASVDQLSEALEFSQRHDLPVFILGGGSNVVVSDDGFPGLTIKLEILGRNSSDAGPEEVILEVAAGESWDALVEWSVQRGLAGLECLSGIPGCVGATPIQNVGAYGAEVSQTITSVHCLDRTTGSIQSFSNPDCDFGYRSSRFKTRDRGRYVVLAVDFRLRQSAEPVIVYPELKSAFLLHHPDLIDAGDPIERLNAVRSTVLMLRRSKSMVLDSGDENSRSVGSFFVNPILSPSEFRQFLQLCRDNDPALDPPHFPVGASFKVSAAWLIERSGFTRGFKMGGVGISSRHALALVNLGGGSSELLRLADSIRAAVLLRFGIKLEQEPEKIA
jgi:UDP-N-acetylmuramate dehydrogenase